LAFVASVQEGASEHELTKGSVRAKAALLFQESDTFSACGRTLADEVSSAGALRFGASELERAHVREFERKAGRGL
jgi:hypothetical protein